MIGLSRSSVVVSGLLLVVPSVSFGVVSGGNTTPGPGNVQVRGGFNATNNTGQAVNDFEFCMRSKEMFPINGFSGDAAPFTGGISAPDPGGGNGVCIRLTGGTVPPGGTINVVCSLFLPEKNRLYIYDTSWTIDGSRIGAPPVPPGGWGVGDPTPGGNGGVPGLPGGQGGGGGAGFFIHHYVIDNDDDVPVVVHDLKLLASMDFYDDILADAPWAQVNTIDLGAAGVVIPAHSSLPIDFQTTGSYLGGHVYSQYQVDYSVDSDGVPIGPGHFDGSTGGDALTIGATELVFGDHPVVPEPAVALTIALPVVMRRRRSGRAG